MTHSPANPDDMRLTPRQLDAYLAKLGLDRPACPDIHALRQLHHAHLMSFTWEALDAFMGWPSSIDPAAAFAKMVEGRRGGWCFEMGGLFGAALDALGFAVTRLCGCVDREALGDGAIGNHLTLRVDLDRPWLAEVGAADAVIEPLPLAPGRFRQRGFDFSIAALDDGWLRFTNHPRGIARIIDFHPEHCDEVAMARMQAWLMREPASPFTQALAVFRHTEAGYIGLQNDRLREVTATGHSELRVTSADHLADVFETVFDLEVPRPELVWDRLDALRRDKAA